MGKTSIEWTDHSINPIRARKDDAVGHYCEKVSDGCANCYASRLQSRFKMPTFGSGQKRDLVECFLDESKLAEVIRRRKPTRYFWCDMTDLFGEWVPHEWISDCVEVMVGTPHHSHQLLTKRPERMAALLPGIFEDLQFKRIRMGVGDQTLIDHANSHSTPPNIWVGTSVENQEQADKRIPELLKVPAAVRFLSCEPLLGPVGLKCIRRGDWTIDSVSGWWTTDVQCGPDVFGQGQCEQGPAIDWVIVGGESGRHARDCNVGDVRSILSQCREAGVACLVKQLGSRPYEIQERVSRWPTGTSVDFVEDRIVRVSLNDSKGGDPSEWPEDLRVREFPEVAHA